MKKIAIIGNAGGGKSALAQHLSQTLDIPLFEVDLLQWRPGWVRTPAEEITRTHDTWLQQPGWVIDGWGDWEILQKRFAQADTLVFVDFPIVWHYWWATKRQVKAILHLNKGWPPPGCPALPVTGRLYKLMWRLHQEVRPQLLDLIYSFDEQKEIVHICSRQQWQAFYSRVASLNENQA